jgi:hypothetical protein
MDTADMKVYAAFHLTRQDIAAGNNTFVLHHEGWCHEYMAGDEDGCTAFLLYSTQESGDERRNGTMAAA